jgi:hypothetical protein
MSVPGLELRKGSVIKDTTIVMCKSPECDAILIKLKRARDYRESL